MSAREMKSFEQAIIQNIPDDIPKLIYTVELFGKLLFKDQWTSPLNYDKNTQEPSPEIYGILNTMNMSFPKKSFSDIANTIFSHSLTKLTNKLT